MEITERADGVTVINDAYNANPDSMKAALRALATIGRGRRTWAVLGEMAELGAAAQQRHDEIGRLVVRLNVDRLIAVGPAVRRAASGRASGRVLGWRSRARRRHRHSVWAFWTTSWNRVTWCW